MQNNPKSLTSPEITNLWTHYARETLSVCVTKYMLRIVKDQEINKLLQTALEMSEQHIKTLQDFFNKENFPVPKGYTDKDANYDAPPLLSDLFCLSYLHTMTQHGSQSYSLAFSVSIRKDMRDFYYQCNLDTMDLYNRSLELLIAKNYYDKPPLFETPKNVQYINHLQYMTDVFGERRKMNSIEVGNVFFNLEKSRLSKALFIAFRQACKDKDVNKFLDKCIELKNKHIGVFSNLLLQENFHTPRTLDTEITNSTVCPFSDRLIAFHVGFLISAAITYYGAAGTACMRVDITANCERAIMGDFLVFGSFSKLIIKKGWLEQPPFADDRLMLS
ncbi:DUF3231 family protein [Neobacillus dielmonensis]|uniref:DUF3231 family protein n=1 Tax=Neobacillus dielmonensis TaxID=1347369 RepID=UPI0005A9DC72|nr:DUF3231 family protein [Neobacillus dielmonensis]